MLKNTASQKVTLVAYDSATGKKKTGDAGNITFYYNGDDGGVTVFSTSSGHPAEDDATNSPGTYTLAVTQGETNYNKIMFSGKSTTSGIEIVPLLVYTYPTGGIASPTNITAATGITVATNSDKTGYSVTGLTASDVGAIKTKTDFLPSATAGAAGGLFIAGTNAATTITTALTTTFTGNLTGSVGSVTGAVGSVTGAVGSVTGNVGGSVASVTGLTTATIATAVLTTQMTESYAADGAAPTLAQNSFFVQQALSEFVISGATMTVKKLDGSTTAFVLTLNDATTPTGVTRSS